MLTPQQAIIYLAAGAADPGCKRCKGLGQLGTVKLTYFPNRVLICPCAAKGVPRLNGSPYIEIQPLEVRA